MDKRNKITQSLDFNVYICDWINDVLYISFGDIHILCVIPII